MARKFTFTTQVYDKKTDFPQTGDVDVIYIDASKNKAYRYDDTYQAISSNEVDIWGALGDLSKKGGGASWGGITGTLSNQTDLNTALSAKQNTLVSGTSIKTLEGQSLLGSGNIDLTKTDVGLGNVDNTSDLNKPISTATQTALNDKQNILVSGTNIKTINGNSVVGSGDLTVGGASGIHGFLTPSAMGVTAMVITSGTNTSVPVSSTMYAYPIIMAKDYTFNSMQIYCQSLLAGANARILIYSDLNSAPNTKLYESTTIDLSTTGTKTITNTMTFTKGTIYWMVLHCGNGGSPLLIRSMSALTTMPIGYQSNNATYNLISKSSIPLGSAPTTFGASSVSTLNAPLIALFQ